ncbi:MAG: TatD family hydrolase [Planctomycetes bacterium]|nr:TatD family hydrolase [Planctomycetota bacterium]MCB9917991.1 TatD family hydrolase [Planctomycetota bacterium]
MRIFEPHAHMFSRVTDDYERMALSGIRVVLEPAFWLGQNRTSVGTFIDYFDTLLGWERFRSEQNGIWHLSTMGLNPREANDDRVNDAVLEVLPRYLEKDGVVGVGEIGLDDQTAKEEKFFLAQLELARVHDLPVLVHTPHRDKKRGFERCIDLIRDAGFPMERVLLDHGNEETIRVTRDLGCVSGFSIYPNTKMDPPRMVRLIQEYGVEGIVINGACDWGVSDPLSVPKTVLRLEGAGIGDDDIERLVWRNPIDFFAQSGRIDEAALLQRPRQDRSETFDGNSMLRGQDPATA